MTDEQITALVARLRSNRPLPTLPHEAADLIEAQAAEIARLREALKALVTAVTFADPPKVFNEVLCHEARVPVEFVTAARAALAQETQP
jgi:hypothetical protein